MNFRFNFSATKISLAILGIIMIICSLSPVSTHAQTQAGGYAQDSGRYANGDTATAAPVDASGSCFIPWSMGCLSWATNKILYLIYTVVAAFIAFAASLIQTMINMSRDITGNDFVQAGFRISLAIANLGFVLALIIIAFATILRVEKYEMKKLLLNLIIAAVAINFSLAIAGIIIDFTNVLGYFFIDGGGLSGRGISDLGAHLANSMQLQNLITVTPADPANTAGAVVGSVLEFGTGLLSTIVSLFFAVFFAIMIAIVFFGIGLMLLFRYLYLTILLILMPLAWLCWVIPELEGLAKKWRGTFLEQAFFLPAVTFFLYLGLTASDQITTITNSASAGDPSSASVNLGGMMVQTGGVQQFLVILVKIGIFMAALLVGNHLKIAGASVAVKGMNSVKGSMLGWAGNRAKQFTYGRLGRKGGGPESKSADERVSNWASQRKTVLGRFGAGLISSGVAKLARTGTSDLVKAQEGGVAKMSVTEKKAALLSRSEPTRIAVLKSMTDKGELDRIDVTPYITENYKARFASNGQAKTFGDMQKATGMDIKTVNAVKDLEATLNSGVVSSIDTATEKLNAAHEDFLKTFTNADRSKLPAEDIFKDDTAFGITKGELKKLFRESFANGIAKSNPGLMNAAAVKMKGSTFKTFDITMKKVLDNLKKDTSVIGKQIYDRAEESYNNTLKGRMGGFAGEAPPAAPFAPPTP